MTFLHAMTRTGLALLLFAAGTSLAATPEQQREKIRAQSGQVLANLYQAHPGARDDIASAAGYATFRSVGVKIGVAGTGRGRGLAVLHSPKQQTYMRFVEVQAGVGAGIKKYDLVFVFATESAFRDFIDKGWEPSGQSTVALRHGDAGKAFEGAVSVSPGVWLYQVTSSGLAAEVTLKGSKYYRDKSLN
jgi:lipid-binding SYLF domain-containing protein